MAHAIPRRAAISSMAAALAAGGSATRATSQIPVSPPTGVDTRTPAPR